MKPDNETVIQINSQDDSSTPPQPRQPWLPELQLHKGHLKTIVGNKWLDGDIMRSSGGVVLYDQFKEKLSEQSFQDCRLKPAVEGNKYAYGIPMKPAPENKHHVQFHHINGNHFLVSMRRAYEKEVYILCSTNGKKLDDLVKIELDTVYRRLDGLPIRVIQKESQQQWKGAGNCGLFAIANAYAFCKDLQVKCNDLFYNEKKMRAHLVKCLEKGYFADFPTAGRNRKAQRDKDWIEHKIPQNVINLLTPPSTCPGKD